MGDHHRHHLPPPTKTDEVTVVGYFYFDGDFLVAMHHEPFFALTVEEQDHILGSMRGFIDTVERRRNATATTRTDRE